LDNSFLTNYKFGSNGGKRLSIIHYPDRILSQLSKPVELFDDKLRTLCQDMIYSMYDAPGIGLAAPQVGKSLRLIVIDPFYSREEITNAEGEQEFRMSDFQPKVLINPVITEKDGTITHEEGCLSLPGIYEEVTRVEKITVEYQDMFGNLISSKESGIVSICIQHEIDHLDGKVFLDHISLLKRNLYKKRLLKEKKKRSLDQ
jgi:peptide deformylase